MNYALLFIAAAISFASTFVPDTFAKLTDDELRAAIAKHEAAGNIGALLILQDEEPDWPRRRQVLHAIWRVYAKVPKVKP